MIIWLVYFGAVAWSAAKSEPPVSSYLPPSNGGAGGRPSAEYGPPGSGGNQQGQRNGLGRPGSLNQPQDSYAPPGQFPPNAPVSQYGAPDAQRGSGPSRGTQQRQGQDFGGSRPGQQFGGGSAGQGRGGSRPQQGSGSPNQPSQEYGAPNQFGGNQNQLGNSQFGEANGSNRPGSGGSFSGRDNSFSQDSSRPNQRPDTSYGPPSADGSSRGRNGNAGTPGISQRPESSYGPPPFGEVSGGDNSFGQGQQNAGQRTPDSSYGPPNADGGRGGGRGSERSRGSPANIPSSSYGTPELGGSSGNNYQGGSDNESNEPAKYEYNYDVDNPQTGTKFGHSEQRDGDITTGEYNVVLPDGRKQVVEYEAGLQGYKPQIRYEGSATGNSGFGAGNGKTGAQSYPRGPSDGNSFQDSSNDLGYEQNNQGGQDRFQAQSGDGISGYPRGGGSGDSGRNQGQQRNGDAGYPRGGPSGTRGNTFGQSGNGNSGGPGRPNQGDSFSSDNGYPRGGLQGNGSPSGNSGYPRGAQDDQFDQNQENQGYPKNGPSQSSNNLGQGRQVGRSLGSDSSGSSGYPREGPRNQVSGNQPFGGNINGGNDEGYPSGGPDGPRGSGY